MEASAVTKRRRRSLNFRIRAGDPFKPLAPGELLLEQLTGDRLNSLRNRGETIRKYQSRKFYEIEAQRAAHKDEITAALQSVPSISVDVTGWCRAIKLKYGGNAPLSCVGSIKQSGRFNYGSDIDEARFPVFPALYLAENRATAHCEMFGHTEDDSINGLSGKALQLQSETSIGWLALSGIVQNVFDLTQPKNLKPFLQATSSFTLSSDVRKIERQLGIKPTTVARTPQQLMTTFLDPAWRAFLSYADIPANSQIFGQLVSSAGFEAIKYKSTRTGKNALAVFPRCFHHSVSVIRVTDPSPGVHCVELSAMTFGDVERETW